MLSDHMAKRFRLGRRSSTHHGRGGCRRVMWMLLLPWRTHCDSRLCPAHVSRGLGNQITFQSQPFVHTLGVIRRVFRPADTWPPLALWEVFCLESRKTLATCIKGGFDVLLPLWQTLTCGRVFPWLRHTKVFSFGRNGAWASRDHLFKAPRAMDLHNVEGARRG